jgi:hypothetical protein
MEACLSYTCTNALRAMVCVTQIKTSGKKK